MSFRTWFKSHKSVPESSPRMDEVVRNVAVYLHSRADQQIFFPQIVAAAVHESEAVTLAAFSVLEDEGIASPRYGTYCKRDSVPIDEFTLEQPIPDGATCPSCDEDLSICGGSLEVELHFVVDQSRLAQRMRVAA